MSRNVSVDRLAQAIEEELDKYKELSSVNLKKAVKRAGNTVKGDINQSAPVRTGRYAKSWRTKVTAETSFGILVTVYSPSRYMLAHLLEHGHAKRGGGRVRAFPHIAPAEEDGEKQLMRELEITLKG